jgi:hypothetical protein
MNCPIGIASFLFFSISVSNLSIEGDSFQIVNNLLLVGGKHAPALFSMMRVQEFFICLPQNKILAAPLRQTLDRASILKCENSSNFEFFTAYLQELKIPC